MGNGPKIANDKNDRGKGLARDSIFGKHLTPTRPTPKRKRDEGKKDIPRQQRAFNDSTFYDEGKGGHP